MKGILYYYSSTGNTRLVCEYIKRRVKNIDLELMPIDNFSLEMDKSYDIYGFASYCQMMDANPYIMNFIEKQKGKGKPAFVINTFGAMNGNTLATMVNQVKQTKYRVVAAHALHCPESYPPFIKKGTTESQAPNAKELDNFNSFIIQLDKLADLMNQGDSLEVLGVSEVQLKKKTINKIFGKMMSKQVIGPKKVHENLCTGCERCMKVCQYNAISMKKGLPWFDEEKCRSCYACFNHCKEKAIYTKKLDGVGHYSEPHVNLREKLNP